MAGFEILMLSIRFVVYVFLRVVSHELEQSVISVITNYNMESYFKKTFDYF